MTPEQIYDTEIAPELLKICQRCQDLGMPMAVQVEFEPGETGRTEFCPPTKGDKRPSAKQLLVHYAVRCNGNIDALLTQVLRDAEIHGHNSIFLSQLGCKNEQPGTQVAAFTVTTPK